MTLKSSWVLYHIILKGSMFAVLPLPVWFNLPIAGGNGNYRQNAMYIRNQYLGNMLCQEAQSAKTFGLFIKRIQFWKKLNWVLDLYKSAFKFNSNHGTSRPCFYKFFIMFHFLEFNFFFKSDFFHVFINYLSDTDIAVGFFREFSVEWFLTSNSQYRVIMASSLITRVQLFLFKIWNWPIFDA